MTATVQSTCRGDTTVAPGQPSADTVAALRPLSISSSLAAPVLELANPSSGALLATGDMIIEGVAYDPAATDGAGVDRVELFLDSRDSGGVALGSAVPGDGMSNPRAFRIHADVPGATNGGHSLVAYAHSAVSDREVAITVRDVFFGAAPTPTPRPKS
jgi:hypothetical protein